MENYRFSDFTLCGDQVLYHNDRIVTVPPKEMAVLLLLVKNAGEVITKDHIIREVWKGGEVSDESLSRCIYVLRKLLGESSSYRYINTVYGKGYLFVMNVTRVARLSGEEKLDKKDTLAIFPFVMQDKTLSMMIFDFIINHSAIFEEKGFRFLPSVLTVNSHNLTESFNNLRATGVRYFLTGIELKTGSDTVIKVELIDSTLLTVVFRDSVVLSDDNSINLVRFNNIISLLLHKISHRENKEFAKALVSANNKLCQIKSHYNNYSFFLFEYYKNIDSHSLLLGNYDSVTLCHLAGCYFSLASLGLMKYEKAEEIITLITDKVLVDEPCNALAISMKTLMCRDMYTRQKESDFQLAIILSPLSAEVYYYYACYLVQNQQYDKAQIMTGVALSLNADFFAAKILHAVILTLVGDTAAAIAYASGMKGCDSSCDIIINCLLAILFARTNQMDKATDCLHEVKHYRDSCAFVGCCYEAVTSLQGGEAMKKLKRLQNMPQISLPKKSVYWMPLFD
ncbi:winged helix-turn-helix domain-containing protein [Erwiniaceae bacterium BAC15a-03b]|uniref:Winged helix-turn-helix domain-containing protein n=1 Tax=Winslowiella arboricola TaxID=2978220 RepID=A0A9J6PUE3_9GAMM|nr:winged helix-turn-helix domain-containing protein [Winslowiella arboricola]MCU5773745.1 winged helix-turn-helix domain-containing protein [Winslowiella arboricola]MCU5777655.1 winged helix-turn-helix domain-containing protein [Winslowiella arboricola]